MSARVFLFYGTDNYSSLAAVREWERLFIQKHGDVTRYCIDADLLDQKQLEESLEQSIQGQSLFQSPTFLLIKRITKHDRGTSSPLSKVLVNVLEKKKAFIDKCITIVIWEDRDLAVKHPLISFFTNGKDEGFASTKQFLSPAGSQISRVINTYVQKKHGIIESDALHWLTDMYAQYEKKVRIDKRLKPAESLLEDDRSWWIYQLLNAALSSDSSGLISKSILIRLYEPEPTRDIFMLVQTLKMKKWNEARTKLREFENDEDFIYSFLGILRWEAKKGGIMAEVYMKYATEIELIIKNFTVKPAWIFELFILRLKEGEKRDILRLKKLWLADLARS